MKRISVLLLALCLLVGCAAQNPAPLQPTVRMPQRVVAASGSFAQIWQLAGGTLQGTTNDSFEDGFADPALVEDVGGVHSPSLEKILALAPDLLLLSSDIPKQAALKEQLAAAGIFANYFSLETFEDYLAMLEFCTNFTGRSDLYQQNGLAVQAKIQKILQQPHNTYVPKVLLVRVGAGRVTARGSNTMAGAMLKDLGCVNIADSDASLLEELSLEVILREDPNFIFATAMGNDTAKTQQILQAALLGNPAWASLSAVRNNHYLMLPKALFHQKPNNRWDEAYQYLLDLLYG
ncbi:MAG: ABC transporter substrate-binding protein [Oscillospiraceae bacterium]|nr:ABC transporter substrate-binding protein [Oscillospiraceae bacterium]